MAVDTKAVAKEISKENQPANQVVEILQRQVANGMVLYSNYKHYHWQTFGPHFRDLHKLFDEFAHEVLETVDEFAERLRMIGQDPVSGLRNMEAKASVQTAGREASMREMIEEADANLMIVIKEMRNGAHAADEQDDPGTNDLFSATVRIHEKHEWFLRQILKKQDGLR